jgi:chromosome segregation ATPase
VVLTTEQKIENKTKLTSIKSLIKDNEAELSTLKDTINAKQSIIEKHESEVTRLREDIALYSPGGRIYISKTKQAEILLSEAEAQKREAETPLQSGHYGDMDLHHYEVMRNSAIENIAKHSTVPEWCDTQVAKFKESLKIYTLKD